MLALFALLFISCTKEKLINEPGNLVPRTVDQDPSLPSITVNGAMLHAEAFGHPDSTLVICLHGGPGSDYRYLMNCKQLADYGYRVVFYDQRGSGLSQRFSRNSYTSLGLGALDVMYDELSGVIAHYRTNSNQKVILFGKSWGGILATGYAGKNPTAIQGLIVAEPGGFKWDDIFEYRKASRAFNMMEEPLNNSTYTDQFITGEEDEHQILDYKMAMSAGDNPVTGEIISEPNSYWRMGAVIMDAFIEIGMTHEPDFSEGISNFNVPVLFFYSEQNQAYPTSWAQKIASTYNSAELHQVMGVGHTGIIIDNNAWSEVTLPKMLSYLESIN